MKNIFDKLRKMSGGKLTQSQVDAANAIATAVGDKPLASLLGVAVATANDDVMQLSDAGFELIAQFEGFRSAPYLDAVGVPTIGYGNTYYTDGRKVKMTDKPISKDEAKQLKLAIINQDFAPAVRRAIQDVPIPVTQGMFDALVSLAYNIGVGGLSKSSVIRHLKAGNKEAAADAFLLWNKAGDRVLAGLTRRRQAERRVFLG